MSDLKDSKYNPIKVGDKVRIIRESNDGSFINLKKGEEAYIWGVRDSFILDLRTEAMIAGRWGVVSTMSWEVELVATAEEHGESKSDLTERLVPKPKPFVPKPEVVAFWDEVVMIIHNDQKFLAEARRLKAERERLPSKFGVQRQWEGDYSRLITAVCKDYIAARGGRAACNWMGLPSNRGIKHILDCIDPEEALV